MPIPDAEFKCLFYHHSWQLTNYYNFFKFRISQLGEKFSEDCWERALHPGVPEIWLRFLMLLLGKTDYLFWLKLYLPFIKLCISRSYSLLSFIDNALGVIGGGRWESNTNNSSETETMLHSWLNPTCIPHTRKSVKCHESRNLPGLFYFLHNPQCLNQCLASRDNSVRIDWMDEWANPIFRTMGIWIRSLSSQVASRFLMINIFQIRRENSTSEVIVSWATNCLKTFTSEYIKYIYFYMQNHEICQVRFTLYILGEIFLKNHRHHWF